MQNLNQLRQALLDTVEDVRTKKIKAHEAMAVAKNAQAVISLTRLELDYHQLKTKRTDESLDFFKLEEGEKKSE